VDDVLKGGTAGGFDGCLQGEGLGVRCLGCCCGSWFNSSLGCRRVNDVVVVVTVVGFLLVWASCFVHHEILMDHII
jgi:hypothetical protein